ncbi:hypothetical protein BH11MYX2_BH11MYX2_38020 [soil metagenome]
MLRRCVVLSLLASCGSFSSSDPPPPSDVRISEVMYHPAAERAYDDVHEFIEVTNAGTAAVDLTGWRLAAKRVAFTFRAVTLEPGAYLVVAKTAAGVATVWGLDPSSVLGDYTGDLANGGDDLQLFDDHGTGVDRVEYEDTAPWPVAADALGAGEAWLPASMLPLSTHENKGISLERVSLANLGNDPANWVASPLDGATPGRVNAGAAASPPPLVVGMVHVGSQLTAIANDAAFSTIEVEWFVDDVSITGEPTQRAALTGVDPRRWSITLPTFSDGSIVRYRFWIDGNVVAPRASDPYAWFAFAQQPPETTQTHVYRLSIAPAAWGELWTNLNGGRDNGCTVNPTWENEVPAVLVVDGQVYDVFARYQGSRYNRTNGPALPAWPYPAPSAGPNPPPVLSWHFSLPRYHRFEDRDAIILNKNTQGCPGYDAGVGFALWDKAGLPAPKVNFAQLHINGGYYHYMVDLESPGDAMMKRYGPVGRLYKAAGKEVDSGALGPGDESALGAMCGLTREQRYELTYDEHTQTWDTYDDLIKLTDDLAVARVAGVPAMRDFFAQRFDLDAMLDHMAIMNWGVPFDDMWQNHFLYERRDGKWIVFPWDLDLDFGGWNGANASLYIGEQGDPDNRGGFWNVMKDSFIKAYRSELDARMREMVSGVLAPDAVAAEVDKVTELANPAEAMAAPAGISCSFPDAAAAFKQFAIDRKTVVEARTVP